MCVSTLYCVVYLYIVQPIYRRFWALLVLQCISSGTDQHPKLSLALEGTWPWPRPIAHGSLCPPESTTQTASRSLPPFCGTRACVQQTHRDSHTRTHTHTHRWHSGVTRNVAPYVQRCRYDVIHNIRYSETTVYSGIHERCEFIPL